MSASPGLLLFNSYMEVMGGEIANRFTLVKAWEASTREQTLAEKGSSVVAILTTGADYPMNGALFDRLPNLKIIVAVGAGYASVDVTGARSRGIMVANAGDTHSGDVASHAIALGFALIQDLFQNDRYARDGSWLKKGYPPHRKALSAHKFGILGLGYIGKAIAERLVPFGGEIAWWGPNAKAVPWPKLETPQALAKWSSILFVASRGDILKLVDRSVIDALGPEGYIVNISRGRVIDEDVLIDALRNGRIAGAGLDVFWDEPTPPERWKDVPNVILSAHTAGQTIESMARLRTAAALNLKTALDGGPVVNEIMS
jgi:lactate dehydrogenase-like 2-hydroxyacid dehydrogenase